MATDFQVIFLFFFLNDPPPPEIYTLSLPDALPICRNRIPRVRRDGRLQLHPPPQVGRRKAEAQQVQPPPPQAHAAHGKEKVASRSRRRSSSVRSEEHTSELQSPCNLVCRLLLEKKK